MTLQQIEYVLALDTERNFVKAANRCFVTQPTLTMQVKKLEDEIGLMLFDRSKKPLQPTVEGQQFIEQCRNVSREMSLLERIATSEKDSVEGTFRLGIIPTLAPYVLPLFLKDFRTLFPNTHLQIKELQTLQIIKALKSDSLDLAILVTPLDENSLKEIPLFYEPFMFYHHPSHPLREKEAIEANDLTEFNPLLLEEGHCFRNQALQICGQKDNGAELGFEYRSGTIETLKNMVRNNMGFTLVPELSVGKQDKEVVKPFAEPKPVREVSLVMHKSFNRTKLVETFQDKILQSIPEHFKKMERKVRIKWR